MKTSIRDADFAKENLQVIGQALQQVDYTEVDYYPAHPQPCFTTDHSQIHTVDFAVCLYFSNGKTLEITWKNFQVKDKETYNVYGLHIGEAMQDQKSVAGQRTWNVSEEGIWQEVIGQRIKEVNVFWSKARVEGPEREKELDYFHLQAIALKFENQKTIIISMAELQAGNSTKVVRGTNNLLITTDESLARKTNMLSEEAMVI